MNATIKERADKVFMATYGRYPLAMVKGEGCRLFDADGKEYLDFLSGIAVCGLGHCHPAVTAAVRRQVAELVHVSNLYYTLPQTELAEKLVAHSFADKVFFCNSGAEANEAAMKLARKASEPQRFEIISLIGSFHGRTLATVAATGQTRFQQGFEPMPLGFKHAPFGDLAALEQMITPATCAILCEPLQGEGGVRPLPPEYLRGIRALCDRHGLFLIFDEVQTGVGRSGTLFAHQQLGVEPDIMTLAKSLAGGLPIGAMLAREKIAAALTPGSHASTFGGNPVVCAAANAALDVILGDGFLESVRKKGEYFRAGLGKLAAKFPAKIATARGMGLILGLVFTEEGAAKGGEVVAKMMERGFLINFTAGIALRFVPPLIVSEAEIDRLLAALGEVLAEIFKAG
ncbi:MAG: acetylornithine transaminase [Desulfobulbaceae bacterium]|jgi:acetylornithine aminotransferase/acetylornithine/N-succinyldiaminopimelate aminotransferase|nr:acetylornithine transaminase [Desulfobulbaceae bacterium]